MRQSFSEYFYFLNELSNKVIMKIEAWEKAALGFLRKERVRNRLREWESNLTREIM